MLAGLHSPNADSSGIPFTPYTVGGGAPLQQPPLDAEIEADVCVVGGGIAGLSTALHARLKGLTVVVLEAKAIGWGASSRNSGHVPAATRQEPTAILQSYGPVHGRRIIEASREAPELVFDLIDRYGMEVSAVRSGGIQAAHTGAALGKLRQRVEALDRLGYALRLLDAEETRAMVGSAPGQYHGASFDPAGGTFNPLAYVRGLARAAIEAGALVYERSPVRSLKRAGDRWQAHTAAGSVRVRHVVLATNGYSDGLVPRLWRSIVAIRAYQFITAPLPRAVSATILPGAQGFTDTRRMMSGIRLHPDGRLHFSGIGPMFGPERVPNLKASLARVRTLFPQIGQTTIDYWWSGWMAMNAAHSWKIHEVEPGLIALLGCNGRGVGLATLYGRELAGYMAGRPASELSLPFQPIAPIAVHPVRGPLVKALTISYRIRDALDMRPAARSRAVAPTPASPPAPR